MGSLGGGSGRRVVERAKGYDMEAVNSILVILLRQFWPLLAGAGVASDDELQKLAGALIVVGSVAYHAYMRYRGKKAQSGEF